jgi:hypothetical protein
MVICEDKVEEAARRRTASREEHLIEQLSHLMGHLVKGLIRCTERRKRIGSPGKLLMCPHSEREPHPNLHGAIDPIERLYTHDE